MPATEYAHNFGHQFQDVSGQIRGQALAKFGEQIATGIKEGQRKRAEAQQKKSAIEYFVNTMGMPEPDAKAAVGSFEKPEDALKAIQMFQEEKQRTAIAQQQANTQVQNAISSRMSSEASMRRAEIEEKKADMEMNLAIPELQIKQRQAETNALIAETAADKAMFARESWEANKKILESGQVPEKILSDGTLLYHDGNSWKQGTGNKMTEYQKFNSAARLMDPDGAFGDYNKRVGHNKGERAPAANLGPDWLGSKKAKLDPMIEKMRKDAGLPNFYKEAMEELGMQEEDKTKPSAVTEVVPEGVTQAQWNRMTPKQKALWQN